MRITKIIERPVTLRGEIANAFVDFSQHEKPGGHGDRTATAAAAALELACWNRAAMEPRSR